MDDLVESSRAIISNLVKEERTYYLIENYLIQPPVDGEPSEYCACDVSTRALQMLNECALLVTDPVAQIEDTEKTGTFPVSPRSVVRFPRHELKKSWSESTMGSNCCANCGKAVSEETPSVQNDLCSSLKDWRERLFDWSMTFCNDQGVPDQSEVVGLAFSILDRYLFCLSRNQEDSDIETMTYADFMLLSMTTLFMASNLVEDKSSALTVDDLINRSPPLYSAQDIIVTENEIAGTLQDRLIAPTALTFCRQMLNLLPRQGGLCWGKLESYCAKLIEITTAEVSFISYPAHIVAVAALELAARRLKVSEAKIEFMKNSLEGIIDTLGDESQVPMVYAQLQRESRHL